MDESGFVSDVMLISLNVGGLNEDDDEDDIGSTIAAAFFFSGDDLLFVLLLLFKSTNSLDINLAPIKTGTD